MQDATEFVQKKIIGLDIQCVHWNEKGYKPNQKKHEARLDGT